MPTLICESVPYYSQSDETAFFNWLNSIACVSEIQGYGSSLEITVHSTTIPEEDLRELIAIFSRYQVDLKQLRVFETAENASWFTQNNRAYWHKKLMA